MAKDKNNKTNAMRILDRKKLEYEALFYDCNEFLDGITIADRLEKPRDMVFKTLVTMGRSKENYVFVLPVEKELDLKKAAKAVKEKSVEMIFVGDILKITGYIRGGCSPIGMKKQFKTVVDLSALKYDKIMFSGGKRGVQLLMNSKNLELACGCTFEDIVAQ